MTLIKCKCGISANKSWDLYVKCGKDDCQHRADWTKIVEALRDRREGMTDREWRALYEGTWEPEPLPAPPPLPIDPPVIRNKARTPRWWEIGRI